MKALSFDTLIYRSLGVPDVLQEPNRLEAAVARLVELCWAAPTDEPLVVDKRRQVIRRDAAAAAIKGLTELGKTGELDPIIGSYGDVKRERLFALGTVSLQEVPVRTCAESLLDRLLQFIAGHPFVDEAGRYFAPMPPASPKPGE